MKRSSGIKKKQFVIDKISEESFFENLFLGLVTILKSAPFVTQTDLQRFPPTSREEMLTWEEQHALRLPEDFRNFYLSTNGLSLTYKFQYSDDTCFAQNPPITGGIKIRQLKNFERMKNTDVSYMTERGSTILPTHCKVFALANLDEFSSVIMAQFNPISPPSFWLYCKGTTFYFLAKDFTTYLRMGLAHLLVPGWEFMALNGNLPEWSAEMLQILAPGIIASGSKTNVFDNKNDHHELNVIDPGVFTYCWSDNEDQLNMEKKTVVLCDKSGLMSRRKRK